MTPSIDGIHPLKHRDTLGPCLFAELTEDNWKTWFNIANTAGFKWIMTDFFYGDWHTPQKFKSYDGVRSVCRWFCYSGIRIAAHCYLNTIDANAKLIDFQNPPWDWGDVLEGDDVGTIHETDDDGFRLVGGTGPMNEAVLKHLAYGVLASGKTMMTVRNQGDGRVNVYRGAEKTSSRVLRVGDPVYVLRNRSGFFAKHGSELQAMLVQRFAQTVADCGIDHIYADGYSSSVQGENAAETARLHWEQGIAPYAANVPAVFSLGGTVPECAFDRVFSVMRGDALTLFNAKYNGDFHRYFYDQLRWNHVNLPLHQASGWWPLSSETHADHLERIYATRGQVVFQDITGDSFLDHPNRDVIVRRMRELNGSL